MPKSRLAGKTAFITGASSGIGKEISRLLAQKGMNLFLTGQNLEKLNQVKEAALKNGSNEVVIKTANLEDIEEIHGLKKYFDEHFSNLDILVNSAGIITLGLIENSTVEDFDRLYRVNLRAPYLLSRLFLPYLKKSRGQIIFVNSSSGLTIKPDIGLYTATKHGLRVLAETLKTEHKNNHIRIISIFPKSTATPMQVTVARLRGKTYRPDQMLPVSIVANVAVKSLDGSTYSWFYGNCHLQIFIWKFILFKTCLTPFYNTFKKKYAAKEASV